MQESNIPLSKKTGRRKHRSRSSSKSRRYIRRILKIVPWRIMIIGAISVMVMGAVIQMVFITDATNQLESSWRSLSRIINVVSNKTGSELTLSDFQRLESGVNDLSRSLAVLNSRTRYVRPFAGLNTDWEVSLELLKVAQSITAATKDMLAGVEPATFFMVDNENEERVTTQISSGERVIELLEVGQGRFIRASQSLEQARTQLDALQVGDVPPEVLLEIENLEQYYGQLHDINTLLLGASELLTEILGITETQNYLLLLQNSDELRPSGGYISTYGWMTVRNGRISNYNYSPTTSTSPFPPPESFAEEFEIPSWWIRYQQPIYAAWDGSWYADFPSTAAMAMQYYEAGDNPYSPIDGVIAIDIVAFEYILEILGSIQVDDYDGVMVTSANFRDVVYDIRAFGEGEIPHKRFLSSLYQQIFEDWRAIGRDEDKNADMLGAVLRAMQEKHIMVYFTDETLNHAVDLLGWSGIQKPAANHDYIMVVDANLGNKSNRSIIRQLTYDVELQSDNSLYSRLSISYDYPATIADNDPAVDPRYHGSLDYNNLLQVFVPANSTLVDANNFQQLPITLSTETHTAFISRLIVPYDEGTRYQFEYTTPAFIERVGVYNRYRLLIQKQPGTMSESANVQISLPLNAQVISMSPEPLASFSLDRLVLDFRVSLTTDQWIEVTYQGE